MKTSIGIAFVLLTSISVLAQSGLPDSPKLPQEWTKDLIIEFSYSGSMDGSHTKGRMTYDSCTIMYQAGHKAPVKGVYLLKQQDRKAIISKLHELKADKIKSESAKAPVDDGYSQLIRIGDLWIGAGPSNEMSSEDRQRFGEVYRYLEGYALRKSNPK